MCCPLLACPVSIPSPQVLLAVPPYSELHSWLLDQYSATRRPAHTLPYRSCHDATSATAYIPESGRHWGVYCLTTPSIEVIWIQW